MVKSTTAPNPSYSGYIAARRRAHGSSTVWLKFRARQLDNRRRRLSGLSAAKPRAYRHELADRS